MTRFNKIYNLILEELTDKQKKLTDKYIAKHNKNLSFGPLFKEERTYFPLKSVETTNIEIPDKIKTTLDNAGFYITEIKEITFPSEEIDTLKKQNRIVTTRVSADYNKFFVDDLVQTPWRDIFKVTKREEISDVKDHPYFNELTEGQKKFLSKYDKIAVLTLMKTKVDDRSPIFKIR